MGQIITCIEKSKKVSLMSNWRTFLDKIYTGSCTKADISRYTKSVGARIYDVYGF